MNSAAERFWSNVDRRSDDECWPWTTPCRIVKARAYPRMSCDGRSFQATRLALRFSGLPEPGPRREIFRTCNNPLCVNPRHMTFKRPPDPPRPKAPIEQVFWSKVDKGESDQCWPWKGSAIHFCRRPISHVALELSGQRINKKARVYHVCQNPKCCNPAHLALRPIVTQRWKEQLAKAAPAHLRFQDLTGKRYGRLRVIGLAGRNSSKQLLWRVKCSCGVEKIVRALSLRNGGTVSCGCYNREVLSRRMTVINTILRTSERMRAANAQFKQMMEAIR
jgi:hypothetical protein